MPAGRGLQMLMHLRDEESIVREEQEPLFKLTPLDFKPLAASDYGAYEAAASDVETTGTCIYLAAQQCSAGGVHSRAWSMSDTSLVVVIMVEVGDEVVADATGSPSPPSQRSRPSIYTYPLAEPGSGARLHGLASVYVCMYVCVCVCVCVYIYIYIYI
jgi:hypothetical protein